MQLLVSSPTDSCKFYFLELSLQWSVTLHTRNRRGGDGCVDGLEEA